MVEEGGVIESVFLVVDADDELAVEVGVPRTIRQTVLPARIEFSYLSVFF